MSELIKPRSFLAELNRVVNSPGVLFSLIGNDNNEACGRLSAAYTNLEIQSSGLPISKVSIPSYKGSNKEVLDLIHELDERRSKNISTVILHGSLATDEQIPYSDFDALAILSDSAFSSKESLISTVNYLQQLSRYFTRHDPIQHHGWFVTASKLLHSHFDDFFPLAIFEHSALLYSAEAGSDLNIRLVRDKLYFNKSFVVTAEAIEKEIGSGKHLTNLYNLKSNLSKFMLLPALYIQLREGKGGYKKESFEMARKDFLEDEWSVMDQVSEVRLAWRQDISTNFKNLVGLNSGWSRKIAKKAAPKLSGQLKKDIQALSPKMLTFVHCIKSKAAELKTH